MARARMYTPGEPFGDLVALIAWLQSGRWVYLGRGDARPKHPSVAMSMTVSTLALYVARGTAWPAIRQAVP